MLWESVIVQGDYMSDETEPNASGRIEANKSIMAGGEAWSIAWLSLLALFVGNNRSLKFHRPDYGLRSYFSLPK